MIWTVPEDFILGPPKTAFASASGTRNAPKTFDSPQRASFNSLDDATVKTDRGNFKDRYSKDVQRDGEQNRDSRQGANQNRRSAKEDSDLWSNARQQKNPAQDDSERPYRRNGDRGHDRDKDGARENRLPRGFENHRREGDRDIDAENGARRTDHGRSRNEPSWYRDEARKDEGGMEDQEATKARDWRDKERRATRGTDREWNRGGKAELDPEWTDTPEPEQKNQIHTREDFERWKERMKTGNTAKAEVPAEKQASPDRTALGPGTVPIKSKVDTPLVVDSGIDGFFGLWNEPRNKEVTTELANGGDPIATKATAKMSKASKFTGLFNPKPEPGAIQEKPSLPLFAPSADSSNEDKEGFQRILNLLGQQQQPQQNGDSQTPPRSQQKQQQRDPSASALNQPSRGSENNDMYSLLGASSPPAKAVPQTTDSEFLLKLMQQPRRGGHDTRQGDFAGRRAGQDTAPGSLPFPNLMISPHDTPQHTPSTGPPPGFFDDLQSRDKLNPGAERRGPPPGFFDGNLPRQSSAGPQQSMLPSGLQRPPGLDQLPPSYPQHLHSQRQNMAPPPGFQTPPRSQNAFPPGLTPNDRSQFGMPANGRGIPPPGFMHPAPPGFPLAFGQEGMSFGAFEAGKFGQGYPPQQRRQ